MSADPSTILSRSFDQAPDAYDELRPDYPDEVYDTLAGLRGGSLSGAAVLDLAAGTGLVTRALAARGARVVSLDPGEPMLRRLRAVSPHAPTVAGAAESLPLQDSCLDMVTCATAWHWLDTAAAVAEAGRVLRPGGHLALWWANNRWGDGVAWEDAKSAVYERWDRRTRGSVPPTMAGVGPWEAAEDLRRRGLEVVVDRRVEWTRTVRRDRHVALLGTHSNVLSLSESDRAALLADVTEALAPWPTVVERIWGPLVIARFP